MVRVHPAYLDLSKGVAATMKRWLISTTLKAQGIYLDSWSRSFALAKNGRKRCALIRTSERFWRIGGRFENAASDRNPGEMTEVLPDWKLIGGALAQVRHVWKI
jgi:hypothetical protein